MYSANYLWTGSFPSFISKILALGKICLPNRHGSHRWETRLMKSVRKIIIRSEHSWATLAYLDGASDKKCHLQTRDWLQIILFLFYALFTCYQSQIFSKGLCSKFRRDSHQKHLSFSVKEDAYRNSLLLCEDWQNKNNKLINSLIISWNLFGKDCFKLLIPKTQLKSRRVCHIDFMLDTRGE